MSDVLIDSDLCNKGRLEDLLEPLKRTLLSSNSDVVKVAVTTFGKIAVALVSTSKDFFEKEITQACDALLYSEKSEHMYSSVSVPIKYIFIHYVFNFKNGIPWCLKFQTVIFTMLLYITIKTQFYSSAMYLTTRNITFQVLVLEELAKKLPSLFSQHLQHCFMAIFIAIREPKVNKSFI